MFTILKVLFQKFVEMINAVFYEPSSHFWHQHDKQFWICLQAAVFQKRKEFLWIFNSSHFQRSSSQNIFCNGKHMALLGINWVAHWHSRQSCHLQGPWSDPELQMFQFQFTVMCIECFKHLYTIKFLCYRLTHQPKSAEMIRRIESCHSMRYYMCSILSIINRIWKLIKISLFLFHPKHACRWIAYPKMAQGLNMSIHGAL